MHPVLGHLQRPFVPPLFHVLHNIHERKVRWGFSHEFSQGGWGMGMYRVEYIHIT